MHDDALKSTPVHCALLCVETPLDATGQPAALPKIHGKSVLFHQIKQLERFGFDDIVIAVDTLPAELPALVEQLAVGETKIRIVRQTASQFAGTLFESDFLVIAPEIWIEDALLESLLSWPKNSIGILAEDPAYAPFERIDLSRRWSGLAVLDRMAAGHCAKMPEGWNIASFLLRHSLQSGAREIGIEQATVAAGALRKLTGPEEVSAIAAQISTVPERTGWFESLLGAGGTRLMPAVTNMDWLAATVSWSPLVLSFAAALSAYFRYSGISLFLFVTALCADVFRQQLRAVEYRLSATDLGRPMVFFALSVTFGLILLNVGADTFDAAFVTLILVGQAMLARRSGNRLLCTIVSPLNLGLALLLAWLTVPLVATAKMAAAALLAANLFASWKAR